MKRDNVNYLLVGIVVVVAFVLFLGTLTMITGRTGGTADYYSHYRNVSGLRYGAPVFYEGFRIGQVGAIDPERTDKGVSFKVELSVRKDWSIPKDSIARMTSTGLLADVAIGITEGVSKDVAPAGSELRGAESADIFAAMNELAGQITILTRDQIAPLIKSLSQHVDSIASVIDKNTPELVEQSKILLSRLNVASDSMNDVLRPDNRAAISAILANTRDLTKELQSTQQKLDDALGQLDSIAKENRPGVRDSVDDLRAVLAALSGRTESIMQHLEVASRNIDEFAREVRKNPNRLLISPKGDKLQEPDQ
ncbi:MAG TPA: MlaD family protein [Rudaea sp.]|jgi:phospholipid/cholesterol/gamma-HCH transport system substrate-binding protein|nr:MlaD family protein [Rudaea sp.]